MKSWFNVAKALLLTILSILLLEVLWSYLSYTSNSPHINQFNHGLFEGLLFIPLHILYGKIFHVEQKIVMPCIPIVHRAEYNVEQSNSFKQMKKSAAETTFHQPEHRTAQINRFWIGFVLIATILVYLSIFSFSIPTLRIFIIAMKGLPPCLVHLLGLAIGMWLTMLLRCHKQMRRESGETATMTACKANLQQSDRADNTLTTPTAPGQASVSESL